LQTGRLAASTTTRPALKRSRIPKNVTLTPYPSLRHSGSSTWQGEGDFLGAADPGLKAGATIVRPYGANGQGVKVRRCESTAQEEWHRAQEQRQALTLPSPKGRGGAARCTLRVVRPPGAKIFGESRQGLKSVARIVCPAGGFLPARGLPLKSKGTSPHPALSQGERGRIKMHPTQLRNFPPPALGREIRRRGQPRVSFHSTRGNTPWHPPGP